jgi:hypothetical protein
MLEEVGVSKYSHIGWFFVKLEWGKIVVLVVKIIINFKEFTPVTNCTWWKFE